MSNILKKTDLGEVFSQVALEQGKYNIDGTDEREKEMVEKCQRYGKLRREVLKKYEKEI